ncbi:hypothetical protein MalM25_18630 [Planctomycetes bacterium MalM25]|nr:hypothetical protein MalM25_18630 [Planctomycetes bacterium MalM25]
MTRVSSRRHLLVALGLLCAPAFSHATTWHVSQQGDDSNPGDKGQPFRTISRGAEEARPGDTVLVHGGVYRERVAPPRGGGPGSPITYRGVPGERVIVKGSEVWQPDWRDEGQGVRSASPAPQLFDDRSDEYIESHNPLKVRLASSPWGRNGQSEIKTREQGEDRIGKCDETVRFTCGQVFVDGKRLTEVPKREELTKGSWWYDNRSERVYVHFGEQDPTGRLVELTTRRRLFAPIQRGLGHITVEGFIFEHCGNQYPTNFWNTDANAQRGAVGTGAGHDWVIRRNVIRHAKTFALDVGRVDRHSRGEEVTDNLVEANYLIDNGSAGVLSNGSVRLVVRGNVILRNNLLRFDGIKRWEQAGVKCHQFRDGVVEDNYIADNHLTYGVWLDNQFPGARVTRNVLVGNGKSGVFLEMSDYEFDSLRIDHNVILGSGENAVYIHDASGATFENNLLANTKASSDGGQAILIRQVTTRTNSGRHTFRRNLLIGNASNVEVNYPAGRSDIQRFEGNLYDAEAESRSFAVSAKSDKPVPWTADEFNRLIEGDLAGGASGESVSYSPRLASMTLPAWRAFWSAHQVTNDTTSRLVPGGDVEYDRATHDLTLTMPADLNLGDANDTPGPFGELTSGKRVYKVWRGLPLVDPGQLPTPSWTLE